MPTDKSPEVKAAYERFGHELILIFETTRRKSRADDCSRLSWLMCRTLENRLESAGQELASLKDAYENAIDSKAGIRTS